jgi:hypothetical protein
MAEPLAWMKKQPARKRADNADKKKAKLSGGEYRVISNSGAGRVKLDLVGDLDAVETKFTDATSFRLKAADLKKLFRQVKQTGRPGIRKWPVMEITMKDENGDELTVVVLQTKTYNRLKEQYRDETT